MTLDSEYSFNLSSNRPVNCVHHVFVKYIIQSCLRFFAQSHCYMTAWCISTKTEVLHPTWRPGSCGIDNTDYIKSDRRNNKPLLDKARREHKTFSMEFQQLSNT